MQTLLNDETKAIRTDLESRFPQLNPNNQNNQNQNQQGNRGNQGNNNDFIVRMDPIITKHNDELLTSMKADLTPDQLSVLEKAEKDKKVCLTMLDVINPNNQNQNNALTRPVCTRNGIPLTERLAPLRDVLAKGKKPLTADQEKKFVGLIETKIPVLQQALRDANLNITINIGNQNQSAQQQQQRRNDIANNVVNTIFQQLGIQNQNQQQQQQRVFEAIQQACASGATPEQLQQLMTQLGGQQPGGGGRGGGNFPANNPQQICQTIGRGGNRGGNQNNNANFQVIQAEILKRKEELLDKVITLMKPDQQATIKRFKYEDIKSRGGAERIRGILEEEGTPLTPEQIPQIQALFNDSNQGLRTWANQVVQQQMEKQPPPEQQPNQQNRNQNFQQQPNPLDQYRQQMVATMLPAVAKQRAQIESAMMTSVMRVLTPSQVASYKINMAMPPLYQ